MIRVTMFLEKGVPVGFRTHGHAGFAEEGTDIVCAAVSALTITAMNAIEALTGAAFTREMREEDGEISFWLTRRDEGSELLLRALRLGLSQIMEEYGSEYLLLDTREV